MVMQDTAITGALEYVKDIFKNEFSGHDYFHTLRVFKMASRIAECENADVRVAQLAAILHDVDDRKLSPETCEKQTRARSFLASIDTDEAVVEQVCRIIREISFSANGDKRPTSLEGMCVQDADRLDAIGAIGIARAFAYGGSRQRLMYDPDVEPKLNMSKEEYAKSESTTVNHFYEKLFKLTDLMNTDAAKEIARRREEYMREFIAEFMDEWDGIK